MRLVRERGEVEDIVEQYQDCDDEGLQDLNAVDSSEDVDRIGAEYGKCTHVAVVDPAYENVNDTVMSYLSTETYLDRQALPSTDAKVSVLQQK